LIEYGNVVAPEGWTYTTITLNHGVQAKKHRDPRNVGKSIIVGFGDYEGGALRVWDPNDENPQDLDLKDKPTMFNGALLPHETQPFTGDRYTVIYYRHKYKGVCKDMPPMIGGGKAKPVETVEDATEEADTGDATEEIPSQLLGEGGDYSKINVVQ
jgi:hypothetical protein